MWVVKPDFDRPRLGEILAMAADNARLKAASEQRMAAYDKLPRKARDAVKEFGQLKAAVNCRSRRAADKAEAVRKAYQRKLECSAIQI